MVWQVPYPIRDLNVHAPDLQKLAQGHTALISQPVLHFLQEDCFVALDPVLEFGGDDVLLTLREFPCGFLFLFQVFRVRTPSDVGRLKAWKGIQDWVQTSGRHD